MKNRIIDFYTNRFIAHVEIKGQVETVHVKNTGRCRELLIPGTRVFLERSSNPVRKTAYDLICVNKKVYPQSACSLQRYCSLCCQ